MKSEKWVPVSSGLFPDDKKNVQVTYLGFCDKEPYCNAFAYRCDGVWYWTIDNELCRVKITAWKSNCEPYKENLKN